MGGNSSCIKSKGYAELVVVQTTRTDTKLDTQVDVSTMKKMGSNRRNSSMITNESLKSIVDSIMTSLKEEKEDQEDEQKKVEALL